MRQAHDRMAQLTAASLISALNAQWLQPTKGPGLVWGSDWHLCLPPWLHEIEPALTVLSSLKGMGARERRDNLRRTWVPTGKELQRLEEERGIVIRFVIGYRWGAACCFAAQPCRHCQKVPCCSQQAVANQLVRPCTF